MQMRKFRVRGSTRSGILDDFRTSEFELRLTKLIEELFPLLIGSELYFGITAQQFVKNLKLPNEEVLVNILLHAGYLEGSFEHWKLSKETLNIVSDRLSTMPRNRSRIGYERLLAPDEAQTAPLTIADLVKSYRKHLKRVPEQHRQQRVTSMFVFFRKLCRSVDPETVLTQIKQFFKYTAAGNQDYRLETFARYVRTVHENK